MAGAFHGILCAFLLFFEPPLVFSVPYAFPPPLTRKKTAMAGM